MKHLFSLKNDFFFFEILPVSFLIAVPTHFCYFFGLENSVTKMRNVKKVSATKVSRDSICFLKFTPSEY